LDNIKQKGQTAFFQKKKISHTFISGNVEKITVFLQN